MQLLRRVSASEVIVALCISLYLNYQLTARFNFMCGQVMGVVDGVYQTSATDAAKFRLGTMADVCFVRGWDWKNYHANGER